MKEKKAHNIIIVFTLMSCLIIVVVVVVVVVVVAMYRIHKKHTENNNLPKSGKRRSGIKQLHCTIHEYQPILSKTYLTLVKTKKNSTQHTK